MVISTHNIKTMPVAKLKCAKKLVYFNNILKVITLKIILLLEVILTRISILWNLK